MIPKESKALVTWSMVGTGMAVTIGKASSGEWPSPRIFLALATIYVILGFMSDVAPVIAGPLAVLVFLAVLLSDGGKAFQALAYNANPKPKPRSRSLARGKLTVVPGGIR